jgi:DNA-directed RNA polymerase subunit alpha
MTDPIFHTHIVSETASYGTFVIEPLDQGYGQTLGNSLRRVLLTSLEGSAITSVRIEGVKHQFSTIPGLKEDIVELVLNLKKVRLSLPVNEDSVELTVNKIGPGQVLAGDIQTPAGVVVTNPDFVLGTLADKKSVLNMTMTANKGFGYVTTDDKKSGVVGEIPMDALYSPIVRVNYRVEATRVGRMTNLDKLVIEVWTDGTITPSEAIKQAAKILVSYFTQIYEPKIPAAEPQTVVETVVSDDLLKTRIEELDIPTRIVNALANAGIETIGQMVATPRTDLMKVKNLGIKSVAVVEEKLKEKGVVLNQT